MKKYLSISAILAFASAVGAETLYYYGVNDDSFWGNASTWVDADGQAATLPPSAMSDIIVDFDKVNSDMRTVYNAIRTTCLNNLTVNSMTWQNIKTLTLKDKTTGAETKSSQFRLAIGTYLSTDKPATLTILNDFKASAAAGNSVSNIIGACELSTPATMPKIIIGGNLQLGDTATKDIANTAYKLEVGNGGCQYVGGYAGPQYFEVGKNLNLIGSSMLNFNVGNDEVRPTMEDPSVVIKGVVNFETSTAGNPYMNLNMRNQGTGSAGNPQGIQNNPVFKLGGISGNGGTISNYTRSNTVGYVGGLSTVVLTNAAGTDYTFWGSIYDDDTTVAAGTRAQIKFVMNGEGIQRLSGKAAFSGGITMMSGTLLVGSNFASEQNHGDLTMLGGKFGNSRTSARTWSSKNLIVGSNQGKMGEIELYVNTSSDFDKLTFSGTAQKDSTFVDGVTKLLVNFTGNVSALVGAGEFKIFSFDAIDGASNFADDDFITTTIVDKDGKSYSASFRFDKGDTLPSDAGLYATFTVVPEPATIAAIVGALALGLALVRRRK